MKPFRFTVALLIHPFYEFNFVITSISAVSQIYNTTSTMLLQKGYEPPLPLAWHVNWATNHTLNKCQFSHFSYILSVSVAVTEVSPGIQRHLWNHDSTFFFEINHATCLHSAREALAVFSSNANFFCDGILLIWSTKWSLFIKLFAQMGCKSRDESNDAN